MREHWLDLAFSLTAGEQHGELEPAVLIPRMFLQCFTYFMACVYLLHRYDYVFVAGITLFSCFRSFTYFNAHAGRSYSQGASRFVLWFLQFFATEERQREKLKGAS